MAAMDELPMIILTLRQGKLDFSSYSFLRHTVYMYSQHMYNATKIYGSYGHAGDDNIDSAAR
jgi:hypothetical protein